MPSSVVAEARANGLVGAGAAAGLDDYVPLVLNIATAADRFYPWGTYPRIRDQQLRAFWPTEFFLASTVTSTATRYSALQWTLTGPPKTARHYQDMLQGCEFGQGWSQLMLKVCIDLLTQDNGAFIEVVRAGDSPSSPVVSLNHLDSNRCVRTGRRDTPVIYHDLEGKPHGLRYYQVIPLTEMPSPVERMRGMQYSAVSRILRFAQILQDITIYKHEKVSGQFMRSIHLVSGVQTKAINDVIEQTKAHAATEGYVRYIQPAVLGALDPNSTVSHVEVPLASLPDNFDEEVAMRWYITGLALAFGTDYQDLAPLPGGGIGSGNQAKLQHLKSRGKGPALFSQMIQHAFNFYGVLPKSVRFEMGEVDIAAEMERTAVRKERALEREILVRSGQITTEVARQMAVDSGDLDPRYLEYMRETNVTDEDSVQTSEAPAPEAKITTRGMAGPKEPPGASGAPTTAPPNNNAMRSKPPSQSQKVNP